MMLTQEVIYSDAQGGKEENKSIVKKQGSDLGAAVQFNQTSQRCWWVTGVCVLPPCTLQTLVSQLQQLPHGGRHGGVERLQVYHALPVTLLHPHSDTPAVSLELHQTHGCTAHASPLWVCCVSLTEKIPEGTEGTRKQSHLSMIWIEIKFGGVGVTDIITMGGNSLRFPVGLSGNNRLAPQSCIAVRFLNSCQSHSWV